MKRIIFLLTLVGIVGCYGGEKEKSPAPQVIFTEVANLDVNRDGIQDQADVADYIRAIKLLNNKNESSKIEAQDEFLLHVDLDVNLDGEIDPEADFIVLVSGLKEKGVSLDNLSEDEEFLSVNAAQLTASNIENSSGVESPESVQVDFYRTYELKKWWIFEWKDYSIPLWRVWAQLEGLNLWYSGHLNFSMGSIYSYGNPDYYIVKEVESFEPCTLLYEFSISTDVENKNHISAIYSKKFESQIFGCSIFGVPLGGSDGIAPAVIITMSNNVPYMDNSTLGLPVIAGATLAHEIGHVIGFDHTVTTSGTQDVPRVITYSECGTDLKYPMFDGANLNNNEVTDPITGTVYNHSDWNGRYNIMAPFRPETHLAHLLEVGLFIKNYSNIFQGIVDCWKSEASY